MRILIADDEAVIRLGLRAMLQDAGHEVVGTASNGRTAVAQAEATRPDVIVLDIKCPSWMVSTPRARLWRSVQPQLSC